MLHHWEMYVGAWEQFGIGRGTTGKENVLTLSVEFSGKRVKVELYLIRV
jgi:hypothetical protein